jgi:formate hydrogenlyase transcriptional activator
MQQSADSMDKTIETIPEETMRALVRHPWPGNVRELQNYVARGVILSTDGVFDSVLPERCEPAAVEISYPTLEHKVRQEIQAEYQRANWKLGGPRGAAARLGLKRTTLFYKMKRVGITPPADHWQD